MLELRRTTSADVRTHIASGGRVAFLPFGALEAHGAHLPLSTDTIVAERVARELAERFDAVLLPAIEYGETWLTSGFPGTLSLSPTTVQAIATDLGRSLAATGLDRIVVVNGDFGNRAPLASAARELAADGIRLQVLDYPGLDEATARERRSEPAASGMSHAEEIETSMVLAERPDWVRLADAIADYPRMPVDFGTRPIRLHEITASGVFGDPTAATAETGERLYAAVVAASAAQVERFLAG